MPLPSELFRKDSPASGITLWDMEQLSTDPTVLVREATNFERIAEALKAEIVRVESIAAEMDTHWKGYAAEGAKTAIARYHDAGQALVRQLNDITTNLHAAAAKYGATDDERAAAVAAAMGNGMGGPNGSDGHDGAADRPDGQVHAATATDAASGHHNNVRLVDNVTHNADPLHPSNLGELLGAPPGAGISPQLQTMLLGGNPATVTGQSLVSNLQRVVQSLPENDPNTAWLRGQVADLQAHVNDIDYARTHCSTSDWVERTSQFATGVLMTSIGGLTAETGAGLVVAGAGGLNTVMAGKGLLGCLTGSK